MTEFSIVHEFETDSDSFWRVFLDSAFQNEMYRAVGMKRSEIRREEYEDRLIIVATYVSDRQLPPVVRTMIGSRPLGYTETLTLRKHTGVVEQHIEMTVLRDRIRFGGTITVEKLGDEHVRREYAGAINVDIALIGKKVEQSTVNEMKRTHEQAAEVLRSWLQKAAA
jgi:hypothetical protein